ncbi:DUF1269 domain-containing protein [Streptomyces sp. ODS28]|uniref:DUF1269 domain-containing protein n=1 Tax=Streptomyces sp. ODS28 TaxID=3136688 RepID=UPI0031EC59B9
MGPVQMLTLGFGAGAGFDGIRSELELLEQSGQIRVLDLLFVEREEDGELVALGYQAEGMGETVAALLGMAPGALRTAERDVPSLRQGRAFGLSAWHLGEIADELPPGTSAAFVLLEHVWARRLKEAVRGEGGVPLAEGFLTPEALAPVAAELTAASERNAASSGARDRSSEG